MGVPSEYDHPALAIFDRTLVNLRHVEAMHQRNQAYVFEFTALLNSLLGLVVHPWDRLLDQERLEEMPLTDPKVMDWGFSHYRSSKPYVGGAETDRSRDPEYLGQLLRWIRNGIAHGNIELLDVAGALDRQLNAPIKMAPTNDIVGVEIWNSDPNTKERKWGTVLSIRQLKELIKGIEALVNDPTREYWSARALQVAAERPVMQLA